MKATDNHRSFWRRQMTCNTLCLKPVLQLSLSAFPSVALVGITSWCHPASNTAQIRDLHIFCNIQATDSHQDFSRTTWNPCTQTPNWNPHYECQSQRQQAHAMASWETWDCLTRAWDQQQHISNTSTFHIRPGCSAANAYHPAFALSLC